MAAGQDDVVTGVEHAMGEVVLPQELPHVFDRVELRRVGRQVRQADVGRDAELFAGLVPTGAVEHDHGMGARSHARADLGQVQVHGLGVAAGQD